MTLTPFRYPGAKNKLLPVIMKHIDVMMIDKTAFCDAFVGGGSVALEVATNYPSIHININDKDWWMYCFWDTVCESTDGSFEQLLKLIDQKPTIELFNSLRKDTSTDKLTCAYKAIFFNRTTFSGIFKSGPIGGKGQKSKYPIHCRYNADKLKSKIKAIRTLLIGRCSVSNFDINEYLPMICCPIYLDPPYYIKGSALYTESMKPGEHEAMRDILNKKDDWLLSYDDCPEVRYLYKDIKSPARIYAINARYCICSGNVDWTDKNEVLIFKPSPVSIDKLTIKVLES